jgi:integrase
VVAWKSTLKWVNRRIGAMPLASVNNGAMRELVAQMGAADFSPATIRAYVTVVKMVVASVIADNGEQVYSRKWNHEYIDLPVVKEQRRPAFTSEQVSKLVAGGGSGSLLYAILAGTGLRIGEALGLEVGHVSPDGLIAHVQQTAWRGKVDTPKTVNAVRDIDLHPSLAELLTNHIGGRTSGYIFQSSRGTVYPRT